MSEGPQRETASICIEDNTLLDFSFLIVSLPFLFSSRLLLCDCCLTFVKASPSADTCDRVNTTRSGRRGVLWALLCFVFCLVCFSPPLSLLFFFGGDGAALGLNITLEVLPEL